MTNIYDQFDEQSNVYDQFDDPKAKEKLKAAVEKGSTKNLLKGAAATYGTGVEEGTGALLGFPMDAAHAAINIPNYIAGKEVREYPSAEISRGIKSVTGLNHQPQNAFERYLHTLGLFTPAGAWSALGQNIGRSILRGTVLPAVASEGAGDLVQSAGGSPTDVELARLVVALVGPRMLGGQRVAMTPAQTQARERLIGLLGPENKAAYPTRGQLMNDPKRMALEGKYLPEVNEAQRQALIESATGLAGRRSKEGITPEWLTERRQTVGAEAPSWQAPDNLLTPEALQNKAFYSKMEAMRDASKHGENPFPSATELKKAVISKAEGGNYGNQIAEGKLDLYNLPRDAEKYMPELPPPPPPPGWGKVIKHYSPFASVAALGGAGFLGAHFVPMLAPWAPHLATMAVGGAAGAGLQRGATAAKNAIQRSIVRNTAQRELKPYEPMSQPEMFARALMALERNRQDDVNE